MNNILLEAKDPKSYFDELWGKIEKKFGEVPDDNKKAIIKLYEILSSNDRINFFTPYLKLAYLNLAHATFDLDDHIREQIGDFRVGIQDKIVKASSGFGVFKTLSELRHDIEHYFGSDVYKEYLKDHTFSGKKLNYSDHIEEIKSIITKFEERGNRFLDISTDDIDGQEMILSGKDSNGLYYEWWSLNSRSCNTKESKLMGHCGANDVSDNMLSLRIPIEPHLKKEYKLSDKEYKNLRKPVLTFAMRDTTLVESHGKNNEKPDVIYHEAIVELFKNDHITSIDQTSAYSSDTTFKLEDLSTELRKEVGDIEEAELFDWTDWGDFSQYFGEHIRERVLRADQLPPDADDILGDIEMEFEDDSYSSMYIKINHRGMGKIDIPKNNFDVFTKYMRILGADNGDDFWFGSPVYIDGVTNLLGEIIDIDYEELEANEFDFNGSVYFDVVVDQNHRIGGEVVGNEYGDFRIEDYDQALEDAVMRVTNYIKEYSEIENSLGKNEEFIGGVFDVILEELRSMSYEDFMEAVGIDEDESTLTDDIYETLVDMKYNGKDSFIHTIHLSTENEVVEKEIQDKLNGKKAGDVITIGEFIDPDQLKFDFYEDVKSIEEYKFTLLEPMIKGNLSLNVMIDLDNINTSKFPEDIRKLKDTYKNMKSSSFVEKYKMSNFNELQNVILETLFGNA